MAYLKILLSVYLEGLWNATDPVKLVGIDLELTRDSDMLQEFQVYQNMLTLRVSQGQYEHCTLVVCDDVWFGRKIPAF